MPDDEQTDRARLAALFGRRDVDPDELVTDDEQEAREFARRLFPNPHTSAQED